ncbi:Hypothetical_protein [Hexamita inflata]|uniref:Hypothetical_protein n=1 Tax=Hexamita inflata TaxID=28002 RepID=A0AA86QKV7_9EUKA|nr:Hypothetical protein HINF_LOCUS47743 [Hexamita inflata]
MIEIRKNQQLKAQLRFQYPQELQNQIKQVLLFKGVSLIKNIFKIQFVQIPPPIHMCYSNTGLIAGLGGTMLMTQSSIIFTIYSNSNVFFGNIGVVGEFAGLDTYLMNLLIVMKVEVNTAKNGNIGFFGGNKVSTSVVKNSIFQNFNITTTSVGILFAFMEMTNNSIINTTIQMCNISTSISAGGFISRATFYSNIIQNSTVKNINITGTGKYAESIGAMIGQMSSNNLITSSYLENSSIINNNILGVSVTAGFIGKITSSSPKTYNISLIDFLLINNNISGGVFTSGIIAVYSSLVCDKSILLLQNLTLSGCNIQCLTGNCSGLVGIFGYDKTQNATLTVKNITMQNILISGPSYVAGFVAISQKCVLFTTLQIYNSTMNSIVLSGQNCGMITGFLNGTSTFDIQTSKTAGNNFVNSTQLQNCASITSGISQSGC